MQNDKWDEFIKDEHEKYKKIRSVSCPAFGGELIYFNKHGWNHLLRKGKNARDRIEQLKRIRLIPKSVLIISTSKQPSGYRKNILKNTHGHFWSFRMCIDNSCLRVVIRQLNNGQKHFFSIMYE